MAWWKSKQKHKMPFPTATHHYFNDVTKDEVTIPVGENERNRALHPHTHTLFIYYSCIYIYIYIYKNALWTIFKQTDRRVASVVAYTFSKTITIKTTKIITKQPHHQNKWLPLSTTTEFLPVCENVKWSQCAKSFSRCSRENQEKDRKIEIERKWHQKLTARKIRLQIFDLSLVSFWSNWIDIRFYCSCVWGVLLFFPVIRLFSHSILLALFTFINEHRCGYAGSYILFLEDEWKRKPKKYASPLENPFSRQTRKLT